MRATDRLPPLTVAGLMGTLLIGVSAAPAQSPSLTLVVDTRFVAPSANGMSAKAQFTDARIPLATFNETDHCIDARALEVAKEYFTTLGPALERAAYFYFVPEAGIKSSVSMCGRLHGQPPQAWVDKKTKIIAFGKLVPEADAPELEKSIR